MSLLGFTIRTLRKWPILLLLAGSSALANVDFVDNFVIIETNSKIKVYDVGHLVKKGASADEIVAYVQKKRAEETRNAR